jgi:hypothetical protein
MSREQIDSILLVNSYFTKCKYDNNSESCQRTELARKYLVKKISKALNRKNNFSYIRAFFIALVNYIY